MTRENPSHAREQFCARWQLFSVDRFIRSKDTLLVTRVLASIGSKSKYINDQLREAIWESGRSSNQIGLETGACQRVIDRFVSRKQDIRLETAAKIAEALGLELRPRNQIQAEPGQSHAGVANGSRNSG